MLCTTRCHAGNCLSDQPSLLMDLQTGTRPLQSNPGRRRVYGYQTPHFGCAAGSHGELFLEGGCCPAVQSRGTAAHFTFYTESLRDLRTSPRASYHEDEVPHGLQGSKQPSLSLLAWGRGPPSSKPITPHTIGQGAEGYGKRVGAGFADSTTENLFGNAILPSLLHQDPRYFYQGTGTKWSRARHAMSAPFICRGDNGKWQPNYSTWGGSLISASISNCLLP